MHHIINPLILLYQNHSNFISKIHKIYRGEYMKQYSWAENTAAQLEYKA